MDFPPLPVLLTDFSCPVTTRGRGRETGLAGKCRRFVGIRILA